MIMETLSSPDLISIIQSGAVVIFLLFGGLVAVSIVVIKRWNRSYLKTPTQTVTAQLIRTDDYEGNPSEQFAEHRQSYSVGKYAYLLGGKQHVFRLKGAYGGFFANTITLYYKKGKRDIGTDPNVTVPTGRTLLFVLWFAIACPALAGAIWLLLYTIIKAILP